jgi:hypothetical protein
VFKRRSSDAPTAVDNALSNGAPGLTSVDADDQAARTAAVTPKKGAPTPKRREAEAGRRQPYQAPADRKAAGQQSRNAGREERMRRSRAQQQGEEWALPAKDRGPVRALARDVVDSRRGIGEYYIFTIVLLVVLLILPWQATKLLADAFVVALLAIMLGEGWLVASKVKRMAQERFPNESTKGIALYVTMRGISIRRMRLPKPKVDRGDKV